MAEDDPTQSPVSYNVSLNPPVRRRFGLPHMDNNPSGDAEVDYAYRNAGALETYGPQYFTSGIEYKGIALKVEVGDPKSPTIWGKALSYLPVGLVPDNLTNYIAVRVRVPELHCHIPEPFAVGQDGSDDINRAIYEMHPLFIAINKNAEKPIPGNVVRVSFSSGLQHGAQEGGIYHGVYVENLHGQNARNARCGEDSTELQNNFEQRENSGNTTTVGGRREPPVTPPPTNFPYSATREQLQAATDYDNAPIPNKSQHTAVLTGLHPDFALVVKEFIFKSWQQGILIQLNSGYRSRERQLRLRREWEAQTPPRRGIRPGMPGASYHQLGMAIDMNPILPDGRTLLSTASRSAWQSSGVVQIAESVGLYWGGLFSGNYDPIHFDFRNTVTLNERQSFYDNAFAAGTTPNRYPITTA